jgi:hypothetical protein
LALLAAAEAPDRGVRCGGGGEYKRAFHGDQFRHVLARLTAAGAQVWLPEAGGPVELDSSVHQALMVLLGAQAPREVARARQRSIAAMRTQTRLQGQVLGGRPPYGYHLADGGPPERHACEVGPAGACARAGSGDRAMGGVGFRRAYLWADGGLRWCAN